MGLDTTHGCHALVICRIPPFESQRADQEESSIYSEKMDCLCAEESFSATMSAGKIGRNCQQSLNARNAKRQITVRVTGKKGLNDET